MGRPAPGRRPTSYGRRGSPVKFLGSLLIPGDEVSFWRFASDSLAGVEEPAREPASPSTGSWNASNSSPNRS